MQILFLVEDSEQLWEESSKKLAPILKYHKSLNQNIILSDRAYISNSIARKCLILQTNEIQTKILLSPSLVINLYNANTQQDIEKYFRIKWNNTHIPFWFKNGIDSSFFNNKIGNDSLKSIVYTTNMESLEFKVISNSVKDKKYIGLVEQSITEYFADRNFYKSWKLNQASKILKNRSSIFNVEYDIFKENGDFTVDIKSIQILNFFDLLQIDTKYVYEYIDAILKFRFDYYIDQVTLRRYIKDLCKEQDIELEPSHFRTFIISKNNKLGLHRPYFGGVNDIDGIDTINDKHLTNVILNQRGFKTNLSYEYDLEDLNNQEIINNIPLEYPLVLKPTNKKKGYGVVTNILDAKKMLFSVKELLSLGDIKPVLIEEFFVGMTYRVLVVAGEVIAVLKYMPTYIVGDGKLTIKELINSKNKLIRSAIRVNEALELSLVNDGYNYDTILRDNHKYILSYNSHASMGGQATNVTDIFSTKLKEVACAISASLGISHTGIDMNVNEKGDYRILEVNCAPALSAHLYPKYGTAIDTYSRVLDAFFTHTDIKREDNQYLTEIVKYHK